MKPSAAPLIDLMSDTTSASASPPPRLIDAQFLDNLALKSDASKQVDNLASPSQLPPPPPQRTVVVVGVRPWWINYALTVLVSVTLAIALSSAWRYIGTAFDSGAVLSRRDDIYGVAITRSDYAKYFQPLERLNSSSSSSFLTEMRARTDDTVAWSWWQYKACEWGFALCHVYRPMYALLTTGVITRCGPVNTADIVAPTQRMYGSTRYRLADVLYAMHFHMWQRQYTGICAVHVGVSVCACVFDGVDGDASRLLTAYNLNVTEKREHWLNGWESSVFCGSEPVPVLRSDRALVRYLDDSGVLTHKLMMYASDARRAQHFDDLNDGKRICEVVDPEEIADAVVDRLFRLMNEQ